MRISDWSSDVCSSDLVALAAGTGLDAAGGQEAEILQRAKETRFHRLTGRRVGLGRGQRAGDAPPAIGNGFVHRLAGSTLEAVLHVPDFLREGRQLAHLPA